MSTVETLDRPPQIDWQQIIEPMGLNRYPMDPKLDQKVWEYSGWYMCHVFDDPEFLETFQTIPADLAVALVADEQYHLDLFDNTPPEHRKVLGDLASSTAVGGIVGRADLHGRWGLSHRDIDALDPDHIITHGKALWLSTLAGYDAEIEPLEGLDFKQLAEDDSQALIEGFRDYISPTLKLPERFYELVSDPNHGHTLLRAVLNAQDPLLPFANQLPARAQEEFKKRRQVIEFMREEILACEGFNDPVVNHLRTLIGDAHISAKLYDYWSSAAGNDASPEDSAVLDAIGITERGEGALTQMTERHRRIAGQVIAKASSSEISDIMTNSPLDFELARTVINWRRFEWGQGTSEQLAGVIETLRSVDSELLTSRHAPSEVVQVAAVEKPLNDPTQDMLDRLEVLRTAHSKALVDRFEALNAKKPDHVTSTQEATIQTIQEKIEQLIIDAYTNLPAASPQKQKAIEFQVQRLETLRDFDFESFPAGISHLAKYKKDIGPELITLLCDYTPFPAEYRDWDKEPTLETLAKIIEHWEHNVVTASLQRHTNLELPDKKAILDLLNTAAFKPLFEGEKTGEKVGVKFVPVRGLLLEASGHIAHACWAEKYQITKQYPNIDALLFVQQAKGEGANAQKENFAGACLLIHSETVEGEPILIIRGLNPSQAFIDKIDAADFYERLTDYVRRIAAKDGRKPAVVIDNKVGRAASNRPKMHAHLRKQYNPELEVRALTKFDTTFNGYEIAGNGDGGAITYYLPEKDQAKISQ